MTYLELCEKLRKRTGTGGGELTDTANLSGALARLTDYVAEAWVDIQAARRDWSFRWAEFSESLPAGSQVYDMDSEIGSAIIKRIKNSTFTVEPTSTPASRANIELLDYDYFEARFAAQVVQTGRPLYLAIEPPGKKVKFNTILDVDYVLKGKYERILQRLVNKDDTPVLPDEYHDAIFYLALMKWAEFEEAQQIYNTAEVAYGLWFTRMVNELLPPTLVGQESMA